MTTRSVSIAITLCLALSGSLRAQQGDGTNVPISTYVFKPNKVPPTAKRIAQISAPKGFRVARFATG